MEGIEKYVEILICNKHGSDLHARPTTTYGRKYKE